MSTTDEPTVKLTYQQYALFPSDGNRHEIVHGRHYMNPAPSPQHQTVSRRIQFQLYQQIEIAGLGQVFNAPIDLELSETNVVQPDLLIVLNENAIVTATRIRGVPDLVVEILSPSNRDYDQDLKKRLYEQHGVPEYWIVDAQAKVVQQNVLDQHGRYTACERTREISFGSTDATVELQSVWA